MILSPHIFNYSGNISNISSILHRITGMVLTYLLLLFYNLHIFNLFLLKYDFSIYLNIIIILFFLFMFNLLYHTVHGLRHLTWDFGEMAKNIEIFKINSKSTLLYIVIVIPFLIYISFIFY